MTEVTINESGFRRHFETPAGPMGLYLARRGRGVAARARVNASGRPGPEIRSGNLLSNTRFVGVLPDSGSMSAIVISDARSFDRWSFNYPIAQELGGVTPTGGYYRYPFLVPALAAEFGLPYIRGL